MCEPQRMHLAATLVPLLLPPPNLCAHCVQPDTGLKIKLDKSEDMIGTVSICRGLGTTPCGETVLPGSGTACLDSGAGFQLSPQLHRCTCICLWSLASWQVQPAGARCQLAASAPASGTNRVAPLQPCRPAANQDAVHLPP